MKKRVIISRKYDPPKWLRNLMPGIYKASQLQKLAKVDVTTVHYHMRKFGAFEEEQENSRGHKIIVYYWDGYKEGPILQ